MQSLRTLIHLIHATCLAAAVVAPVFGTETHILSLAGEWRFQLDKTNAGVNEGWQSKPLTDTIRLPGTTDENEKGVRTTYRPVDRLARVWDWKGPAWYQKDVTIPESWAGKRVTLFLERTKHILDETPRDYHPIIQVIDNFDRYHKLGLLFETCVGKGSLLVCAIDLPALQDHPEARQFLHSLLQYTSSPVFNPGRALDSPLLRRLLPSCANATFMKVDAPEPP